MDHEKNTSYSDEAVARNLHNGIALTFERLPYLRSATVGVWTKTGSANEEEHQAGISHFLEHLMFKGTGSRTTRQLIEPIESKGGHLNAFTSREYTCLYAKTLDEHISTAIEILADIIKNSTFADLEKERNVVLEEIASIEDVPEDYVHELLAQRLWPNHPLGRSVSGYEETVSKLSIEDMRTYYRAWYRPRNICLSIAGNFDENAVIEQIYREFEGMQPRPAGERCGPPEFGHGIEVVERDIAQIHFCLAFPGPTVADKRRYTFDVLSSALGGGSTSRLFQRIREDEGLAYAIYSFHSSYFTSGMFGVYAAVAPEKLEQTLGLVFEEIRKFRDEPLSREELDSNREHLKGSMLMALESTSSRMTRMAKSMMYYNRLQSIQEIIGLLDAVTVDDIHAVAQDLFRPERCAMVLLGPASGAALQDIAL